MLSAKNTPEYEPTADDELWLARAVQAEGPPRVAVARALVNCFMLQRSLGSQQTLAHFVRAYAQPVNPKWFPDGALFLATARTPLEVKQAELRRDGHSKRTVFDAPTVNAVRIALRTPYLTDVTDYAVPSLDASKKGYVPRGPAIKGENRFWTRKPGWSGYYLSGGNVVVLVAIAVAAWAVWGRG